MAFLIHFTRLATRQPAVPLAVQMTAPPDIPEACATFFGTGVTQARRNAVSQRTVAANEAEVVLFEPAATRNTGNIVDETFTAPNGATR